MNIGKALICGSVVCIAGAALWAAIAYYANFEIAWLAWGIGFAVGIACVKGAGSGNVKIGILASILTILSILLGKYATIDLVVNDQFANAEVLIQKSIDSLDEESLTSYLAGEAMAVQIEQGNDISWPEGVDPEFAATKEDYPAEIWAIAEQQWNDLSPEAKKEFRTAVEQNIRSGFNENFEGLQDQIRQESFFQSFSAFDLLFFALAIYTAFSVGQSSEHGDDGSEAAS